MRQDTPGCQWRLAEQDCSCVRLLYSRYCLRISFLMALTGAISAAFACEPCSISPPRLGPSTPCEWHSPDERRQAVSSRIPVSTVTQTLPWSATLPVLAPSRCTKHRVYFRSCGPSSGDCSTPVPFARPAALVLRGAAMLCVFSLLGWMSGAGAAAHLGPSASGHAWLPMAAC